VATSINNIATHRTSRMPGTCTHCHTQPGACTGQLFLCCGKI